MNGKRLIDWKIGTCAAVIALSGACVDLNVVNLNDPDRDRALTSASDVEALVSGGFQAWWATAHYSNPACALSTAADAHSSSWGNWGMRDAGWEPRKAYNNDPAYSYRWQNVVPWSESYQALAAVRDGLLTINADTTGKFAGDLGPDNLERLIVFGKFIQAMSLANLAVTVDQAFVVDETVDNVGELEMKPYAEVWAEAEKKFAEVIQRAGGGTGWDIPSAWVAFNGDWSGARTAELARAFRARYRTQVPRTASERDALDWNAILQDATPGLSSWFAGYYQQGGNWAWHRSKVHCGGLPYAGWARIDYRTVGPADASGAWEQWINASPDDKRPFDIDTDDRRVTGPTPQSDGSYIAYMGNSPFPPDRGLYHYSNYIDYRWLYIYQNNFVDEWPDLTNKELEFIAAEANYRLGNKSAAMATVNKYRENGALPPFTNPDGTAPGGNRCVPQMPDGSCGDLWEALKYEKRIELFHYGYGTEYFDDRGWGDLVQWTWEQYPVPGQELLLLLEKVYTFGGPGGNSSASGAPAAYLPGAGAGAFETFFNDFGPRALTAKRRGMEAWVAANRETLTDVGRR